MKRTLLTLSGRAALRCGLTLITALCLPWNALAEEEGHSIDAAPYPPEADVRSGGVLAESYRYHRQGAAHAYSARPTIAPNGGWYGYGFPVTTHRWGWFGAERYYPRVVWHRGYYGDCCRSAYRQGY